MYWPNTIKDTIKWFPFISIMEHTANIIQPNTNIITSLLKVFEMFELRLIYDKDKLDSKDKMCANSKKTTGL